MRYAHARAAYSLCVRVRARTHVYVPLSAAVYSSVIMDLKSCCRGKENATIATIKCSENFNLKSVLITRESLFRLCGYGDTTTSRYLDDQVSVYTSNYTKP